MQKLHSSTQTESTPTTTISDSKCELCGGSGVITKFDDGNLFARNCECTERKILENKVKFANIPDEFKGIRVADFNVSLYQQQESINRARKAKEIVKNYMLNYDKMKEIGKGIYLYSDTKGSGKTMLSIALGNALMNKRGEVVRFATVLDILEEIKASFNDKAQKESTLINDLKKVPVLIMDDIGTERLTGWVNDVMYQIINDRLINRLVTIFTSNTHISQLKHDERIVSRIEKMAVPIQMPEESIRKYLAKKENDDLVKELLGI